MSKKPLCFVYKNWKGETSTRRVVPLEIFFGTTEYHTEEQYFLKAYDLEKKENRDFAMNDIVSFKR